MKIEHLAIWTNQLEIMKEFYVENFEGIANKKYFNPNKNFQSYFITFNSGARLEIMFKPNLKEHDATYEANNLIGLTHFAFEVKTTQKVDELATKFAEKGIVIIDGPRQTGDGYYEFTLLDPDGNRIEIIRRISS